MWNSEWEYENQDYLKEQYEKKMSGENPCHPVRKIICKGVVESFIPMLKPRNIVFILCAATGATKRN